MSVHYRQAWFNTSCLKHSLVFGCLVAFSKVGSFFMFLKKVQCSFDGKFDFNFGGSQHSRPSWQEGTKLLLTAAWTGKILRYNCFFIYFWGMTIIFDQPNSRFSRTYPRWFDYFSNIVIGAPPRKNLARLDRGKCSSNKKFLPIDPQQKWLISDNWAYTRVGHVP